MRNVLGNKKITEKIVKEQKEQHVKADQKNKGEAQLRRGEAQLRAEEAAAKKKDYERRMELAKTLARARLKLERSGKVGDA